MTDQRFERLETGQQDLQRQMREGQERMMKTMEEMFAASTLQVQQMIADAGGGNGGETSRTRSGGRSFKSDSNNSLGHKLAKLDFPKYDGSNDPIGWVSRVEQFFEFKNIAEEEQFPLAAYHLDGEAQLWYQLFRDSEEELTWEALKDGLHARYGPT